jgi:hypothetical protein
MWNVSIVAKRATILPTAYSQEKITMNSQTWYPSQISKNLFQSSFKEMLTKKDKQSKKKENTEGDDESLDMNVFEKLMEGKHTKSVNKSNDDSKSINDANNFAYHKQNKMTDKSCEDNNYNDNYDELAYPFSKRI